MYSNFQVIVITITDGAKSFPKTQVKKNETLNMEWQVHIPCHRATLKDITIIGGSLVQLF
jgi:hypothetical protein